MPNLENVTIHKEDIVVRKCEHCGTDTLHVGKTGLTCLQCIADSNLAGCCTLKQYNRWTDEKGLSLAEPKGRPI